jgi:hypothetical protein
VACRDTAATSPSPPWPSKSALTPPPVTTAHAGQDRRSPETREYPQDRLHAIDRCPTDQSAPRSTQSTPHSVLDGSPQTPSPGTPPEKIRQSQSAPEGSRQPPPFPPQTALSPAPNSTMAHYSRALPEMSSDTTSSLQPAEQETPTSAAHPPKHPPTKECPALILRVHEAKSPHPQHSAMANPPDTPHRPHTDREFHSRRHRRLVQGDRSEPLLQLRPPRLQPLGHA